MINTGQDCTAATRAIVAESLYNDSVSGVAEVMGKIVVGDPADRTLIHAGCVWINDHIPIISELPHGGFGASGFVKDMSQYSLAKYLPITHVKSDIPGMVDKDWHRTIFAKR